MKRRRVILPLLLLALLVFTGYVLLDTFVIVRRYETNAEPLSESAQPVEAQETSVSETADRFPVFLKRGERCDRGQLQRRKHFHCYF